MPTALRKRKVSFMENQSPTKEWKLGGLFNDAGELTGGLTILKTYAIEVSSVNLSATIKLNQHFDTMHAIHMW